MPRTLALALIPLSLAIFAGCASSAPAPKSATQECPAGYFWNGTECEKQRTIVLDQGTATPPPPPPPPPSK